MFGARRAVRAYNRLADAVMHIARVYLAIMALHYVDDTGAVEAVWMAGHRPTTPRDLQGAQFLQYSGIRLPRQGSAKTTLFPRLRKRLPQGSSPDEGDIGRVRFDRVQPELRTSAHHPLRRARQEDNMRVRRHVNRRRGDGRRKKYTGAAQTTAQRGMHTGRQEANPIDAPGSSQEWMSSQWLARRVRGFTRAERYQNDSYKGYRRRRNSTVDRTHAERGTVGRRSQQR